MYSREIFSGELLRSVPCCSIIVLMIPSFYILLFARYIDKGRHCLQKGPYFKDLLGILGPYFYFRVLIFTILASFTQRMSYLQALVPVYTVGKF